MTAWDEFHGGRRSRPRDDEPTCGKCWACRTRVLLARIDRAKETS